MSDDPKRHRFLTIDQAAEELNVKQSLVPSLIRSGELRAIQVGGRGIWSTGANDLEDYIAEGYRRTAEHVAAGELKDDGEPDAEQM